MSARPMRLFLCAAALSASAATAMCAEQPAPTLTVLYDNYVFDKQLEKDWGFGCLVSGLGKTILFDTGTKWPVLEGNMKKLGVSPAAGIVVISHNHRDHTGALLPVLEKSGKPVVYMICGGMHLLDMPEAEVRNVAKQLKDLGVQKIGATHCTGEKAIAVFKEEFGDRFVPMGAGRIVTP